MTDPAQRAESVREKKSDKVVELVSGGSVINGLPGLVLIKMKFITN